MLADIAEEMLTQDLLPKQADNSLVLPIIEVTTINFNFDKNLDSGSNLTIANLTSLTLLFPVNSTIQMLISHSLSSSTINPQVPSLDNYKDYYHLVSLFKLRLHQTRQIRPRRIARKRMNF